MYDRVLLEALDRLCKMFPMHNMFKGKEKLENETFWEEPSVVSIRWKIC
jgi:hypothetical protein